MKQDLKCLRCETTMKYVGTEEFQLGRTGWILGDLPNLLAGAMMMEIYYCPKCHKIEFFAGENPTIDAEDEDRIAQKTCPACKREHDMDYPKCPYCGHDYR